MLFALCSVLAIFPSPSLTFSYPLSVRAGGAYRGDQLFAFLPRYPALLRSQAIGFSLIGLVLQFADALIFVFLVSGSWAYQLYGFDFT